jgi:putative MATE family efflux protein
MNNEFLAKEPVGKLLFKLSIPTVVAQLINMLYNLVDRIFIGHMPVDGDLALTGVGVCLPLIMLVSAFAALVSAGGAPRSSIFMGKKDNDTAEKIMGNCFFLQIIISVILTVILLIFNRELLLLFGASENTIEYAVEYMNMYAIGTIFVQLTLGMNAYITSQGFSKIAMLTVLIGAVCNIALDPIFIYGFNMGVSGAALATIVSQAISCSFVILFLFGKKSILKLKPSNFKLESKIILPCMALGLAPFIMQMSECIIIVSFNSSLLEYGGDIAVGAMTILSSVMQFAMLPLQGLAQGAQPISSYNFGAKNADRVVKTFKLLLLICMIYSTTLYIVIMTCPQAFVSMFTDKQELIEFTAKAMRRYFAVLFVFGAQIACQMTFVSTGNAKSSIMVACARKFVLLLPLIYIMPAIMEDKTMAVYTAEPVADFLAVTFTVVLFTFQFKKSIKGLKES